MTLERPNYCYPNLPIAFGYSDHHPDMLGPPPPLNQHTALVCPLGKNSSEVVKICDFGQNEGFLTIKNVKRSELDYSSCLQTLPHTS